MPTRKLTALIIGNSSYPGAVLANPVNDAEDIFNALTALGFSAVKITDATNEEIDRAINSFKDNLNSNEVGLFYFAGHGCKLLGQITLQLLIQNLKMKYLQNIHHFH